MRQVLTNIMGNAVKFTDRGHVLVRAVGIETGLARQAVHITVEDTGIGIAPENLDHVFGEFNQVEAQANRKFEGTGLGLAITRRLVEAMGGEVWVDSELGRGSSFGFRLPLSVAEEPQPPDLPKDLRRVLVVDDQLINRTILERQLVPCGIAVSLARSADEALRILSGDGGFDVVLTDHNMPEMTGPDLVLAMRERGIGIPVVLLSSSPADMRGNPAEGEVAAVLSKPILRAELFRRLNALSGGQAEAPVVAPIAPQPAGRRLMRVLAAEDNRTNQLVFRKMVADAGIDLRFANNGREAVEAFQTFDPDVIFMDVSMPEMDGREATMAIRALERETGGHVPIIALTAHAMDGDAAGILAAGMDRYMTKPLRKAMLFATLNDFAPAGISFVTEGSALAS
jgi:CheY-like chemotaxis protein